MRTRSLIALGSACARMGFKKTLRDWITLLGSFLTYTTIMLLYAGVIHMIPAADLAKFSFGQKEMVWYLGTAEFILFAVPSWYFRELQNDIQSGAIDLATVRPVSGAFICIAVWCGECVGRCLVFAPPYLFLITLLAGDFGFSPLRLMGLAFSLPLGIFINAAAWYIVGGTCLWIKQAEPLAWIWQKSIFLFGAMLWPLSFYPFGLQVASWMTPAPAILAIGSRWALGAKPEVYAWAFFHQIVWVLLGVFFVKRFEGRIVRKIQESGG